MSVQKNISKVAFSVLQLLLVLTVAQGGLYEFVLDNDEIFDSCPGIPDNNGMNDVFDFREVHMEFDEGRVNIRGNGTCIWEGVQPTDRINASAEFYKFSRGTWQLTPYTMSVQDFCKVQFDSTTVWFQLWTKYIPENERKCFNNYGHTYHNNPFSVDTVFEFPINMEGRYKIVGHTEAFDQQNVRRSKTICYQIFGEFVKVKN